MKCGDEKLKSEVEEMKERMKTLSEFHLRKEEAPEGLQVEIDKTKNRIGEVSEDFKLLKHHIEIWKDDMKEKVERKFLNDSKVAELEKSLIEAKNDFEKVKNSFLEKSDVEPMKKGIFDEILEIVRGRVDREEIALSKPNKNEIESKINLIETEIKSLYENIASLRKDFLENISSPKIEIGDIKDQRGGTPEKEWSFKEEIEVETKFKNKQEPKRFQDNKIKRSKSSPGATTSLKICADKVPIEISKNNISFDRRFPDSGPKATGPSKSLKSNLVKLNKAIGKLSGNKGEAERHSSTESPIKSKIAVLFNRMEENLREEMRMKRENEEVETPVSLPDIGKAKVEIRKKEDEG